MTPPRKLPSAEEWADRIHAALTDHWNTEACCDSVMIDIVEKLLEKLTIEDRNAVLEAAAEHLHKTDYEAAEGELRAWMKEKP